MVEKNVQLGLKADEEKATEELIQRLTNYDGLTKIEHSVAQQCIMARKLDVERAFNLYLNYQKVRKSEQLEKIDPLKDDSVLKELTTGKLTILPERSEDGAVIGLFTARLHYPKETTRIAVIHALVYQLDAAMRSVDAQRNGLIFIYDMTSAKFPNFDYDLSVKILTILKGSFPARLKKILIVKAPLWFRAPFKVLRLFVREKLRDRVYTVDIKDLNQHVPMIALPNRLGGEHVIDHKQWLMDCFRIHSPDTDSMIISEKLEKFGVRTPSLSSVSSLTEKQSNEDLEKDELVEEEESIHTATKEGMTPLELSEHVNKLKEVGLHEQYSQIRMERIEGTFEVSKQPANVSKNRYTDVHCLDSTRVKLKTCSYDDDYINANFVDGYLKSAMYISTQGPLTQTFRHFWRMVWEQGSHVIVMTTRVIERGRMKCGQYWPLSGSVVHDQFEIENLGADREKDFSITRLKLKYLPSQEERLIQHFQFTSWPDYGTPPAGTFLNFMYQVRAAQGDSRQPIIVHCSAGIGRTGTFICMDIGTSKLDDTGYVDVRETVRRIRSQRAHSIQMPDQYVFCHKALLYYAQTKGFLKELRLELFDERSDSD